MAADKWPLSHRAIVLAMLSTEALATRSMWSRSACRLSSRASSFHDQPLALRTSLSRSAPSVAWGIGGQTGTMRRGRPFAAAYSIVCNVPPAAPLASGNAISISLLSTM